MSNWDDFLEEMESELANEFETATLDDFEELPEGIYKTRIDSVEKTESKKSRKPMVQWKFKVLEGKYQGRYIWKNNMMEKDKVKYLTKDIIRCGVAPGSWKDLKVTLLSLYDLKVDVEIKVSISGDKSFRNVNIIGLTVGELPF